MNENERWTRLKHQLGLAATVSVYKCTDGKMRVRKINPSVNKHPLPADADLIGVYTKSITREQFKQDWDA